RVWKCTAARTASTALGNSARNPSPVFFTMRPPCSAIAVTLSARSLFMIVHEPRIASDVGNQYRRQSALDPDWLPFNHGCNPTTAILYDGSDGSTKSDLTASAQTDVGYWTFVPHPRTSAIEYKPVDFVRLSPFARE